MSTSKRGRIEPSERLRIIAAFVVLWLASTGALAYYATGIDRNGKHTAEAERHAEQVSRSLRQAQIANCKRGNERTVSDNASQLDDYGFFSLTAALIKASLSVPPPPNPNETPAQRAKERARAEAFVVRLEGYAHRKVWHHLIENCAYAVDHPATYKLPPAVPFVKHLPPKSALTLGAGE